MVSVPDLEIGTNSRLNWKQLFWAIWLKANVPWDVNDDLPSITLTDSTRQAFFLEEESSSPSLCQQDVMCTYKH